MKTIIFDLKGTLVDTNGELRTGARELLAEMQNTNLVLYTMNEPWSYNVLVNNSEYFTQFNQLLLVRKKRVTDLQIFTETGNCMVVGDSETEELAFGRTLGQMTVSAADALPVKAIREFMELTS